MNADARVAEQRLVALFRLLPRLLRDPFYRWIARNRYRWFGRREACMVPSADNPGVRMVTLIGSTRT